MGLLVAEGLILQFWFRDFVKFFFSFVACGCNLLVCLMSKKFKCKHHGSVWILHIIRYSVLCQEYIDMH